MVNTRLDGRVDVLEKDMEEVCEKIVNLDANVTSMTKLLMEMVDAWKAKENKEDEEQRRSRDAKDEERSENKEMGTRGRNNEGQSRKLELPLFMGDDLYEWIFRAERYFTVNGMSDGKKVKVAAVYI